MKHFTDFKTQMSSEKINTIAYEITEKLKEMDYDPIDFVKVFNVHMTMKLLEEYHDWLNH